MSSFMAYLTVYFQYIFQCSLYAALLRVLPFLVVKLRGAGVEWHHFSTDVVEACDASVSLHSSSLPMWPERRMLGWRNHIQEAKCMSS